jgi:hypothetical protein
MKPPLRLLAAVLSCALVLAVPRRPAHAVAAGGHLLDGRSFVIQITEKDLVKGSKPVDDTFIFSGGKLVSDWLRSQGYSLELAYMARSHGDAVSFTAHATSKRRGDVNVAGTVQIGGHGLISGTLSWSRKGEKVKQLEFSGTAKVKVSAGTAPP